MNLHALPAFDDNYIWMMEDGVRAVVVDPGDAAPVLDALQSLRLQLAAILVTHHHGDHVGGLAALQSAFADVSIFGPATERMPVEVQALRGGDVARIDMGAEQALSFEVIDVPGHTAGHIAYAGGPMLWNLADKPGTALARWSDPVQDRPGLQSDAPPSVDAPILFCGDTLFSAGCGRLFEGTPAQMLASLDQLAALPDSTLVCCAHEYTMSNLAFAHAVEPANPDIARAQLDAAALRAQGRATLPSTIGRERRINPFLRTRQSDVRAAAQSHADPRDPSATMSPQQTLGALRHWKNTF